MNIRRIVAADIERIKLQRIKQGLERIRQGGSALLRHVEQAYEVLKKERSHLNRVTKGGSAISEELANKHSADWQRALRGLEFLHTLAQLCANGNQAAWQQAESEGITRTQFESGEKPKLWKSPPKPSAPPPSPVPATAPASSAPQAPADTPRPQDAGAVSGSPSPAEPEKAEKGMSLSDLANRLEDGAKVTGEKIRDWAKNIEDATTRVESALSSDMIGTETRSLYEVSATTPAFYAVMGLTALVQAVKAAGGLKRIWSPDLAKKANEKINKTVLDLLKLERDGDAAKMRRFWDGAIRRLRQADARQTIEKVVSDKGILGFLRYMDSRFDFLKMAAVGEERLKKLYDEFESIADDQERLQKAFSVHADKIAAIVGVIHGEMMKLKAEAADTDYEEDAEMLLDGIRWMGQLAMTLKRRGDAAVDTWGKIRDKGLYMMSDEKFADLIPDNDEDGDLDVEDVLAEAASPGPPPGAPPQAPSGPSQSSPQPAPQPMRSDPQPQPQPTTPQSQVPASQGVELDPDLNKDYRAAATALERSSPEEFGHVAKDAQDEPLKYSAILFAIHKIMEDVDVKNAVNMFRMPSVRLSAEDIQNALDVIAKGMKDTGKNMEADSYRRLYKRLFQKEVDGEWKNRTGAEIRSALEPYKAEAAQLAKTIREAVSRGAHPEETDAVAEEEIAEAPEDVTDFPETEDAAAQEAEVPIAEAPAKDLHPFGQKIISDFGENSNALEKLTEERQRAWRQGIGDLAEKLTELASADEPLNEAFNRLREANFEGYPALTTPFLRVYKRIENGEDPDILSEARNIADIVRKIETPALEGEPSKAPASEQSAQPEERPEEAVEGEVPSAVVEAVRSVAGTLFSYASDPVAGVLWLRDSPSFAGGGDGKVLVLEAIYESLTGAVVDPLASPATGAPGERDSQLFAEQLGQVLTGNRFEFTLQALLDAYANDPARTIMRIRRRHTDERVVQALQNFRPPAEDEPLAAPAPDSEAFTRNLADSIEKHGLKIGPEDVRG